MSRIGKLPIAIPDGVEIKIDKNLVSVKGPKGQLTQEIRGELDVKIEDKELIISRKNDEKETNAFHGLYRSLINSMVIGVSKGFKKTLQINGVGYKAEKKGNVLNLALGYSHPIDFDMPEGIDFKVENNGREIILESINKQLIGQIAANIRNLRKPEPYKGKGIKYSDETINRKEGKTK
ncbi:MAG: 50S ribosomal protein L6 [Spirochaetota bacterium]